MRKPRATPTAVGSTVMTNPLAAISANSVSGTEDSRLAKTPIIPSTLRRIPKVGRLAKNMLRVTLL